MKEGENNIYGPGLEESRILSNTEIAPNAYVLSLPKEAEFQAGQVVGLALNPGEEPRFYSICSGTGEDSLQVLYNVKNDGYLTPRLGKAGRNDRIWLSRPFGSFLGTLEPAYWIAAGTGIAPFLSMFRSGQGAGKVLIHGGRTLDSFYFQDEFMPYLGNDYIRCCSQEQGEGVFEGRLTHFLQKHALLPQDHKYYLCGMAEMVVEARDILISKGIPFENIMAEIYF
jgi:ferredoxin--NADP+ reductase